MDKQQKDGKEWWILTDRKYHISRESRMKPNQPHRLNKRKCLVQNLKKVTKYNDRRRNLKFSLYNILSAWLMSTE